MAYLEHADLIVCLRGTMRFHADTLQAIREGLDGYSLMAMWSQMLGMTTLGGADPQDVTDQWGHADAKEDWQDDGLRRDLLWFHATVPGHGEPATLRIPVQSVVTVMCAGLDRLGQVMVSSVQAELPLQNARPNRVPIAIGRDLFAQTGRSAPAAIEIRLNDRVGRMLAEALAERLDYFAEIIGEVARLGDTREGDGVSLGEFWGWRRSSASPTATIIEGVVREWSPALAAWLLEALIVVGVEAGLRQPLLAEIGVTTPLGGHAAA